MQENSELKIIYLEKDRLQHLKNNPRKAKDPKGHEKLKGLIREHGFRNPLEVYLEGDGMYSIIVGNHRFDAGCELGMTVFPCLEYRGTREQALARAISDNRSNEWTEWDIPELKGLMVDLNVVGLGPNLTGFEITELQDLKIMESPRATEDGFDSVAEADKISSPRSTRGDVWLLGVHRVMCGDSTSAADVGRVLAGGGLC